MFLEYPFCSIICLDLRKQGRASWGKTQRGQAQGWGWSYCRQCRCFQGFIIDDARRILRCSTTPRQGPRVFSFLTIISTHPQNQMSLPLGQFTPLLLDRMGPCTGDCCLAPRGRNFSPSGAGAITVLISSAPLGGWAHSWSHSALPVCRHSWSPILSTWSLLPLTSHWPRQKLRDVCMNWLLLPCIENTRAMGLEEQNSRHLCVIY